MAFFFDKQDPGVTYGSVMRNTVKQRGLGGFYRGLSSMVYFAAPKAAIRFGAFEFCSGLLSTADGGDKYGLGPVRWLLSLLLLLLSLPFLRSRVVVVDGCFRRVSWHVVVAVIGGGGTLTDDHGQHGQQCNAPCLLLFCHYLDHPLPPCRVRFTG